jgi:hypothetical protein
MKTSNPSTPGTEAVAPVELSKMGWQKIGLPTAIRTGQPAHEAIEKLVSGYLNKGELRKDDYCLRELSAIAREALSGLYQIASSKNDDMAAIAFVNALLRGIHFFSDGIPFKVQQPGYTLPVFRKLAEKSSAWPGVLSVDHDQLEANKKIIALLRLGENAPLNFKKKQWTRKTAEVRVALNLLEHRQYLLHRNERIDPYDPEDGRYWYNDSKFRRLGPLTRANYAVWWKKFEPMFLGLYGKDFENHKEFSGYWKNSVYRGQTKARALIRRDIKKRIQQAFRSIAPKSPPMC